MRRGRPGTSSTWAPDSGLVRGRELDVTLHGPELAQATLWILSKMFVHHAIGKLGALRWHNALQTQSNFK